MEKLALLLDALPWIAAMTAAITGGWVFTVWLRIKNGCFTAHSPEGAMAAP